MHIIGVEYRHTMSQYYECNRSYVAVCGVVLCCFCFFFLFFFFNDTATTEIYTLSLHDALPISRKPAVPSGC